MPKRLAYLYSRYPVVSQTFCDSEMLALEALDFELEVVSLNPPPDSFRHERLDRLRAEIHYPPPDEVLAAVEASDDFQQTLGPLIGDHETRYGPSYKASVRARNAWHAAARLRRLGVSHVHVHFANRATHSALFLKRLGFTFSFTAHAQDFMVDLGSDALLREMVQEAEFVVTVSDFSRNLLLQRCPGSAAKTLRIYNGIEVRDFPAAKADRSGPLQLVSIGRLIEFKGFQHLVGALRLLKKAGVDVRAQIIGEGPWRGELEVLIAAAGLEETVCLPGTQSQEQIKAALAEAQVFVHPGIMDSKGASDILPTVIAEAMASGLPVVGTTVAGIPEMVMPGRTGLLVEPGNEQALAAALREVAANPERRKAFGEEGRRLARERFALAEGAGGGTAALLGACFERVLAARPAWSREESSVVYYLDAGDIGELAPVPVDPRLQCVAGGFVRGSPLPAREMDFVPDAVVQESLWLRRSSWRRTVEKARAALGDAVPGEDFYTQARRACWLAESLPRRGVKHLHAFRSNVAVTVWLWKKLTGLSVSVAVEENPALSRQALKKMLPDFNLASVSDPRLSGAAVGDRLQLQKPRTHTTIHLGVLRLKRRLRLPIVDRQNLEMTWFEHLIDSLHA